MLSAIVRLNTLRMGWTDRDDTLSRSRGQRRSEEARRGRHMSSDFHQGKPQLLIHVNLTSLMKIKRINTANTD